jgi:hypothetical protein
MTTRDDEAAEQYTEPRPTELRNKRYLGDGVYASQRGTDLVLTTKDGHQISLQIEILQALFNYLGLVVRRKDEYDPQ